MRSASVCWCGLLLVGLGFSERGRPIPARILGVTPPTAYTMIASRASDAPRILRWASTCLLLQVATAGCRKEQDPGPLWSDTGRGIAAVDLPQRPITREAEAMRIGEEILIAKFGRTVVNQERPLVARLDSGVWTISGSLPKNSLGGVGTVKLSAQDGHLMRVSHSF
jgi:hypothetical protein